MTPTAATARKRTARDDCNIPSRGDAILDRLFSDLCALSGTSVSLKAFHLWKQGEYLELVSMSLDPFFYEWNDREADFELDYQVVSTFKSYKDFTIDVDREAAGFQKWLDAEESCRKANSLFRSRWMGSSPPLHHHVEEVLHLARRKIGAILGTVKPSDLDCLRDGCHHGPGGDTALVRHRATGYEKYRSVGEITAACSDLYDDIFGGDPEQKMWGQPLGSNPDFRQDFAHKAQIVRSSKLSFVPKTAIIDRAICIEPRWNVYVQLGIGALLERRLRRVGVSLRDQTRNQGLAEAAYSRHLATMDLSSASDTLAINLVRDLLGNCDPLWLDLIEKSRCATTRYKGVEYRLEKVSSMGNGYTFPLESLIFYAFAWAATTFTGGAVRDVSVFGDDIIVPRSAFSLLADSLVACGFKVNTKKSYANGSFYESCGSDFWQGRNVRPFFIKEKVANLTDVMILHNKIVRWARNGMPLGTLRASRIALAERVLTFVPKPRRLFGPTTIGGVFHAPFVKWEYRLPQSKKYAGWEGVLVRAICPIAGKTARFSYYGHLYSKLASDLDCGNWVISPGEVSFKVKEILVPTVEDFTVDDWF